MKTLTLDDLNAAAEDEFVRMLGGIYEHSPWIAQRAWLARPFRTLVELKHALVQVVREARLIERTALVRAHPELAGKAAVAGTLTLESTNEQARAGLAHCTPEEFATLQQLNAAYNTRFGWPFILAVRGPRGAGLTRAQIIETFRRRLDNPPDFELAECVRNVHRIAEIRLDDRFGLAPTLGNLVLDWADALAQFSEPAARERGQLTVTYLSDAHRQCAQQLQQWMRECGFDEVSIDAVGNVVGRYHGSDPYARALLTGSHYDTVRNAGKYDGRLGVFVPMACVRNLAAAKRRLPFAIEVVAFSEEEGQRFPATFLGSGALIGQFDAAWLDLADANGLRMRDAMRAAGLPATIEAIRALKRDPARYLGFVEVHIEQGPVLEQLELPLGVVTSINGSVRYLGEVIGTASHAGTTPMKQRRDAACAVAEIALYVEKRAGADADSVGTVGLLEVPDGSINVIPGRCRFSLDLRAPTDGQRDRMVADIVDEIEQICMRRGVRCTLEETLTAPAAPSDPALQMRWELAVRSLGLSVHRLPSGAGHDAMKLHEALPQAMLFVRGANGGISHNPLEAITNHDAQLCVEAMQHLIEQFAAEHA